MTWSEKPTNTGQYWLKTSPTARPQMVYYSKHHTNESRVFGMGFTWKMSNAHLATAQWYGPIEPPE